MAEVNHELPPSLTSEPKVHISSAAPQTFTMQSKEQVLSLEQAIGLMKVQKQQIEAEQLNDSFRVA